MQATVPPRHRWVTWAGRAVLYAAVAWTWLVTFVLVVSAPLVLLNDSGAALAVAKWQWSATAVAGIVSVGAIGLLIAGRHRPWASLGVLLVGWVVYLVLQVQASRVFQHG